MNSNFTFLKEDFPLLHNLAQGAEYNAYQDPVSSLVKLRQFVEMMVDTIYNEHYLEFPYNNTLANRIKDLQGKDILPPKLVDLSFAITKKGNIAAHQVKGSTNDVIGSLLTAFKISKWLYQIYGNGYHDVSEQRFKKPEDQDARHALHLLEQEHEELQAKFEALQQQRNTGGLDENKTKEIKEKAHRVARKIDMTEAETRELIDQQLREAGWEADTQHLNYKTHGTLPQRGRMMAIAEWRTGRRWADYALFIGTELYGLVEAKKYNTDISTNLDQAKVYATDATEIDGMSLLGIWGDYGVPFLFSTNGRKYLAQLKTKSGIWFLDVRNRYNQARSLKGWYSPDGLKKLYEQNRQAAEEKLREKSLDFLSATTGLGLRDYQLRAIQSLETVLLDDTDRHRALIAMATGTGKTRTIIGLAYRLISTNRFRRILFLVDRRMLALQAGDAFQDNRIEHQMTFGDAYRVDGLQDMIPDIDTRLHFATVQSMVRRLFYAQDDSDVLPIDTYDCIIVDEAHRGYLLDRELDDEELTFKNEDDYVSMYRRVIDYFDAFTIGLTATPALHTTEIFGKPIYTYSYREAVIDGWLIDHEPPVQIKTELSENGIVWEAGSTPQAYDPEDATVVDLDQLEDKLCIEIAQFNRGVVTESYNRTVVSYLVQHLDPDGSEKTLVFATNDNHADLIVRMFIEEFEKIGITLTEGAVAKITGAAYDPDELLKRYKNEQMPNIVVTVDLLTTGIDVPSICHLVFMRRVRSRILYEQMLGRATRRCDEIGKEVFKIYDAVRMYEALEDLTNMRPVTVNPTMTITELAQEMPAIMSEDRLRLQVEQIITRLQRKKINLREEDHERFVHMADDRTPDELIQLLKEMPPAVARTWVEEHDQLWPWLDRVRPRPRFTLVSDHEDRLIAAEAMYSGFDRPEDYLESFTRFIHEQQNKIDALHIVCTRPTLLDRESLKALRIQLNAHGYKQTTLQKAWKEAKNEDIAADIISYIRTLALGSELIDHETRIRRAMDSVRDLREWNAIQRKWLGRFEKQLLAESVLRAKDLDQSPFRESGGYERLNKIFNEEIDTVISTINEHLYKVSA